MYFKNIQLLKWDNNNLPRSIHHRRHGVGPAAARVLVSTSISRFGAKWGRMLNGNEKLWLEGERLIHHTPLCSAGATIHLTLPSDSSEVRGGGVVSVCSSGKGVAHKQSPVLSL